jgi:RNA recognition motif-containing protein
MAFRILVQWLMYKIFLKVSISKLNSLFFLNTCIYLDIDIARNGIYISRDMSDNALGGGYVAFVNMDHAYKAIDIYNQKHIQHRFGWAWVLRGKRQQI